MGLLSREQRIGEHSASQIATKDVLNFARNSELRWSNEWELSPVSGKVVACPKSPLVCTDSFGLNISSKLSWLFSSICLSLHNVVVFLAANNFSPEAELPCILFQSKPLNRKMLTLRDLKMR